MQKRGIDRGASLQIILKPSNRSIVLATLLYLIIGSPKGEDTMGNKKVKTFVVGCGLVGRMTMSHMLENGIEIIGAADLNPNLTGKDIGEHLGIDPIGSVIYSMDNLEELLRELRPDVCLMTVLSKMSLIYDVMKICASNGINMLTSAEEAMFPSVSAPVITEEIDRLARENGCTISGSGFQDAYWGVISAAFAGAVTKPTLIDVISCYGVDDYDLVTGNAARQHGAGMTLEEFEEKMVKPSQMSNEELNMIIANGEYEPSYMWNMVPWLCDFMGLTPVSQVQEYIPEIAENDLESVALRTTIYKGMTTGCRSIVRIETEEGITIQGESIGKVYAPGEHDYNQWIIKGLPDLDIMSDEPDIMNLTVAGLVNRIPDVIAAPAGFVPTSRMGMMQPYCMNKNLK